MFGKWKWLAAAGLLATFNGAASAHHSFAVFFDPQKEVTITGTVTSFRFTNPHGTITLNVKNEGGEVEPWRVETNSPVILQRRGWTRTSLKPGDVVTIDGWLSRDGRHYLRLRSAKDARGHMVGQSAFGQDDG